MKFCLSVLPIIFVLPFCAVGVPLYTVTDIGTLGGSYTFGNGINNSGQIILFHRNDDMVTMICGGDRAHPLSSCDSSRSEALTRV